MASQSASIEKAGFYNRHYKLYGIAKGRKMCPQLLTKAIPCTKEQQLYSDGRVKTGQP